MKRLLALLIVVGLAVMVIAPNVSRAHPITAQCAQANDVRVVVFQHNNYTGAWDDWCSTPQIGFPSKDPSYANNDAWGSTDIGDFNNMNDMVSAVSLHNTDDKKYCVTFYRDANTSGVSFTEYLGPFEVDHFTPNVFDNDAWSSHKVRRFEDGVCFNSH